MASLHKKEVRTCTFQLELTDEEAGDLAALLGTSPLVYNSVERLTPDQKKRKALANHLLSKLGNRNAEATENPFG